MDTTDKMLKTLHGMTKNQLVTLILTLSSELFYTEDERAAYIQKMADYRIDFDKKHRN